MAAGPVTDPLQLPGNAGRAPDSVNKLRHGGIAYEEAVLGWLEKLPRLMEDGKRVGRKERGS